MTTLWESTSARRHVGTSSRLRRIHHQRFLTDFFDPCCENICALQKASNVNYLEHRGQQVVRLRQDPEKKVWFRLAADLVANGILIEETKVTTSQRLHRSSQSARIRGSDDQRA